MTLAPFELDMCSLIARKMYLDLVAQADPKKRCKFLHPDGKRHNSLGADGDSPRGTFQHIAMSIGSRIARQGNAIFVRIVALPRI